MYTNILVPVSFDDDRDNAAALAVAKALSGPKARVTLLHVMEQVPSYAISYLSQDYLRESREAVKEEIARMASALPGAEGLVVEGHSGRTILDWAAAHDVDCIIIASHRPGMKDYLLGSTAAQVVRHAGCAVHVVR